MYVTATSTDHLATKEEADAYSQPLIDDNTQAIIINTLYTGVCSCLSLFGICSNVINIVVYVKLGMKDSVAVQFIALSILDCIISTLGLAISICVVIGQIMLITVDPFSLGYCLGQAREKAYSMSITIILLMSLERSFCVTFPFTVKLVFRKSRTIKAVVCMAVIYLTLFVPEYLTHGLAWTYDVRFNSSRLFLWMSPERTNVEVFKNSILSGLLPVLTGMASTICALYIVLALKLSKRFRHSFAASKTMDNSRNKPEINQGGKSTKTRLPSSDVRQAKTVVVVDIIFVTCNIPKCTVLATSILTLRHSEFSTLYSGKYKNLMVLLIAITYTFETANSACSFFIYYVSSTRFRTTFMGLFCKQ